VSFPRRSAPCSKAHETSRRKRHKRLSASIAAITERSLLCIGQELSAPSFHLSFSLPPKREDGAPTVVLGPRRPQQRWRCSTFALLTRQRLTRKSPSQTSPVSNTVSLETRSCHCHTFGQHHQRTLSLKVRQCDVSKWRRLLLQQCSGASAASVLAHAFGLRSQANRRSMVPNFRDSGIAIRLGRDNNPWHASPRSVTPRCESLRPLFLI
jgi:hypothetical protein